MVYGALGSDTGGSIRLPAAACGVVGMKATYGRVSRAGAVARSWSLDHVGPLTRTVRDNARMLAVIAGHDPNNSTTSEKPVPDYEALLDGGVAGCRIGLALPNDGLAPLDPEVGAAVQAAADTLGRLGAQISAATLPDFTALYRSAEVMVKCEAAAMHRPVDGEDARALRQPGAHAHGGGLLHPGDAVHRRAAPARAFRRGVPRDLDGRRRRRAAAGDPLPDPDDRGNRHRGVGRPGRPQHGRRLHRPHPPVQHARRSRAVGALRLRLRTAPRSACNWSAARSTKRLLYRIGHAYQGATDFHRKVPV